MDLEKIASLVSVILSAVATIIATLKKGKKTITIEEIKAKEEARKEKRIAKAMKKNKIEVDTATKSEATQIVGQNPADLVQATQQVTTQYYDQTF